MTTTRTATGVALHSSSLIPSGGNGFDMLARCLSLNRRCYNLTLPICAVTFPVLYKLVVLYNNRGEGQTARELAEQMMRLARSAQDPYLLAMAHGTLGWTLYQFG